MNEPTGLAGLTGDLSIAPPDHICWRDDPHVSICLATWERRHVAEVADITIEGLIKAMQGHRHPPMRWTSVSSKSTTISERDMLRMMWIEYLKPYTPQHEVIGLPPRSNR